MSNNDKPEPAANQSFADFVESVRSVGGDAWDQVADPAAELERLRLEAMTAAEARNDCEAYYAGVHAALCDFHRHVGSDGSYEHSKALLRGFDSVPASARGSLRYPEGLVSGATHKHIKAWIKAADPVPGVDMVPLDEMDRFVWLVQPSPAWPLDPNRCRKGAEAALIEERRKRENVGVLAFGSLAVLMLIVAVVVAFCLVLG